MLGFSNLQDFRNGLIDNARGVRLVTHEGDDAGCQFANLAFGYHVVEVTQWQQDLAVLVYKSWIIVVVRYFQLI